jgi:uncharacterized heparinase superfamily protein
MTGFGRFARSIAHTRPRQLVARLAKTVAHAAHDRFGGALTLRGLERSVPHLASSPPQPVFAARRELAREGSSVRVLSNTHSVATPIDWQPHGWSELERLTLHYTEFLEGLGDADFERVARDWIVRHPPRANGSWRSAWNSYALSLRVVVWMQQLAQRRQRLTGTGVDEMHTSLAVQLRFLERNLELDLGGNHLIKNAKALVWAGRYFTGDEAQRWFERGRRLLARELGEQILADGLHYERSAAYHAQVFADLIECATLADDAQLTGALDAMAQVLADTTHPDGLPSLFNDGGLHMSYAPSECLAAYSKLTGKTVQPRAVFALEAAGYFGVRGDSSLVLADCGSIAPDHLPAHGHGDALAFEWTVAGRRVIVDAGVFEYEQGPWRERARATGSHNTVTLDDQDQCEFWSSFRVGRRAHPHVLRFEARERGFVLEGSHDGFACLAGQPEHVRKLTATPDSIEVEDRIVGGAGQRVRARLLLHPDAQLERVNNLLRIELGPIAVALDCAHPCDVVEAWWCPDFGVRLPTKQLVITYPPAPCRGAFRLVRRGVHARAPEPPSLVAREQERAKR